MRSKRDTIILIICMALAALLGGWMIWMVPRSTTLPDNYSYTADILSVDNLYDTVNNQFSGESLSRTKFAFTATGKTDDVLEINGIFDVRTPNGEPIFSVTRLYGIDPKNGRHVSGFGDQNRDKGYLFGPRGKDTSDFYYWHINYNKPVLMKFQETDNILGLPVNKYSADFHADQTNELAGKLPNVGSTEGINLDVHLNLWIEPTTGSLVKYDDAATAYYYDLQTGQRLHPWNKFSNTFTFPSVTRHVTDTQQAIIKIYLIQFVVPIALLLIELWLVAYLVIFHFRLHRVVEFVPSVLFVFGIMISALVFQTGRYIVDTQAQITFGKNTEDTVSLITDRMAIHANGLRGARGLFDASEEVSRQEFKQYVDQLAFAKNYPGIQGFGRAVFFPSTQLAQHTAAIRAEGFPTYTVYPQVKQATYSAIIYIEPFDTRNQQAFGFDMYQEPIRHAAMQRAIDNDTIALSGMVQLVQENTNKKQPGFLLYNPLYRKGASAQTVQDRKEAVTGVVYTAYRAGDFFNSILRDQSLDFDLHIYDGKPDPTTLLYDNSAATRDTPLPAYVPRFSTSQKVVLYGHTWTMRFQTLPGYTIGSAEYAPTAVFGLGVIISALLSLYVRYLLRARQETLDTAAKMTVNVQTLQRAVDDSSNHTIITDPDGIITYANKAAQRITGYSLEEMKGKTPRLWKSDKTPPETYAVFWHTIKDERRPYKGEFINRRKSGELYTVLISVSPIVANNELIGFIGIEEDITKRVASEDELKRQKSELERINSIMVERELRMIELKKELKEAQAAKGESS